MIFVIVMLLSNLFFLIDTPSISEIRAVDIAKIFSTGLLSGVLIVFISSWSRERKNPASN